MSIHGTQTGKRVKKVTNLGIGAQIDLPGVDHEGTLTATNANQTAQESFNIDGRSIAQNQTLKDMQNFQHKISKAVNHSRQSRQGKNIFGQGQSSGKGASDANGADVAQSLPQSYLHQMMA